MRLIVVLAAASVVALTLPPPALRPTSTTTACHSARQDAPCAGIATALVGVAATTTVP